MLSWAFFMSAWSKVHWIVWIDADRTSDALHRAVQDPRLHGLSIAIIWSGIEFVLDQRCLDDDILVLWQLGLTANAGVRITGPALHLRKEFDRGWNLGAA